MNLAHPTHVWREECHILVGVVKERRLLRVQPELEEWVVLLCNVPARRKQRWLLAPRSSRLLKLHQIRCRVLYDMRSVCVQPHHVIARKDDHTYRAPLEMVLQLAAYDGFARGDPHRIVRHAARLDEVARGLSALGRSTWTLLLALLL